MSDLQTFPSITQMGDGATLSNSVAPHDTGPPTCNGEPKLL